MTASSLVADVSGVMNCVVGDSEGCVLESRSPNRDDENIVAAASVAGNQLGQLGDNLGLGRLLSVSSLTSKSTWVVALPYRKRVSDGM